MRKTIPLAFAAAALMATTSLGSAQNEMMEYEYFVRGAGNQQSIVNRETGEERPLLRAEGDARPADCAEGDYYILGENTIVSCDDETAMFDMVEPPEGMTMDDGTEFDATSRLVQPRNQPDRDAG